MLFPKIDYSENVEENIQERRNTTNINDVLNDLGEALRNAISENAANEVDSEEGTVGAKNVKTYAEAFAKVAEAEAAKIKAEAQLRETEYRHEERFDDAVPAAVGIVVTGLVTVFWLLLEQNAVVPQRLVQMSSKLITPKI